jgi:type 1 fimbriae regulatory protein FimB/type 1 fimbriae regulatory protein FimE
MGQSILKTASKSQIHEVEIRDANHPNGTVPPRHLPNAQKRQREYLTPKEVEELISVAKTYGRYGHRDATMILLTYRHGLRVSELCSLRWNQVDLEAGLLHVRRLKHGIPSVHPLHAPELWALRKLQRESQASPYLFVTERGSPMTADGFRKLLSRIGSHSSLTFPVHPHMLRHGCGYKLVNDGHDTRSIQHYLGHKNIQHTVRYTQLSPGCFNDFWQD